MAQKGEIGTRLKVAGIPGEVVEIRDGQRVIKLDPVPHSRQGTERTNPRGSNATLVHRATMPRPPRSDIV